MLAGPHNDVHKVNTVLRAPKDIAFSIGIKRERMRLGQYQPIGFVEMIIFENDKSCQLDSIEARRLGRRLYWPDSHPVIGITKPEEDLVFTSHLKIPLPQVPALAAEGGNPYRVDRHGRAHLRKFNPSALKPFQSDEDEPQARHVPQRLERIASAKYENFLVFHPVAQISTLTKGGFGVFGSHRYPISSLTGGDGTKMALLIDPYTGEAYFTGGRYSLDLRGEWRGFEEKPGAAPVMRHRF